MVGMTEREAETVFSDLREIKSSIVPLDKSSIGTTDRELDGVKIATINAKRKLVVDAYMAAKAKIRAEVK